jgi:hypothetical protein
MERQGTGGNGRTEKWERVNISSPSSNCGYGDSEGTEVFIKLLVHYFQHTDWFVGNKMNIHTTHKKKDSARFIS